jgi:hypothetical protein
MAKEAVSETIEQPLIAEQQAERRQRLDRIPCAVQARFAPPRWENAVSQSTTDYRRSEAG